MDAELIMNLMVAVWLSANAYTWKFGSIWLFYAPIWSNWSDWMDSSIWPDSTLISISKSTDNSNSKTSTTTTTSSVPTSSVPTSLIETKTITNTVPTDTTVSIPTVVKVETSTQ